MSKWIKFLEQQVPPDRKTKIFLVLTTDGVSDLGTVKWFGRWRCYSFFPNTDTVFEKQCLRDIADFCEAETKAHKA
jgi:hypothetical protein